MASKISFIGAGNVAWHLSKALENAGYGVAEVYSRDRRHASLLADRLYDARATDDMNLVASKASFFFLTVPDHAHEEVMRELVLPENATLVHTSGSRSLTDLEEMIALYSGVPVRAGVFYPLQSFSKQVPVSLEEVPLCLEATDAITEHVLVGIAQDISRIVYLVNSQERKVLHVAAVFANNFTNHLWAVAKGLLDEHHLEFSLLKPLIQETVRKALLAPHPADVQTGPAIRGDTGLIREHLDFLLQHPSLRELYQTISKSISGGGQFS